MGGLKRRLVPLGERDDLMPTHFTECEEGC